MSTFATAGCDTNKYPVRQEWLELKTVVNEMSPTILLVLMVFDSKPVGEEFTLQEIFEIAGGASPMAWQVPLVFCGNIGYVECVNPFINMDKTTFKMTEVGKERLDAIRAEYLQKKAV